MAPSLFPPHKSAAPRFIALFIQSSRRIASFSEIKGPIKVSSYFGSTVFNATVAENSLEVNY